MVAGRCPDEMLTSYLSSQPSNQSRGKALFRYCNIRTYFNDELFMVLPNGDKVYFVETRTNYTVLFDGDSAPLDVVRYPRSPDRAQIASHSLTKRTATRSEPRTDEHVSSSHGTRTTLREPLPFTWELCHGRFCHFAPDRIQNSAPYIVGQRIASLGSINRSQRPCLACVRGAFRGHRLGKRETGKWTRFAQRIYSDSCVMPKSTPFQFTSLRPT